MAKDKAEATRRVWLETLARFRADVDGPGSEAFWAPDYDTAPRDRLRSIQDAKLKVLTPFLYENSAFYRRRFDRLGLTPDDIAGVDDLSRWPVVDKSEMMQDTLANPPFGTFTTVDDGRWAGDGWMTFSTSGTSGAPRLFRYTQTDRRLWQWPSARALHAMGIRPGQVVMLIGGFGMHVWHWGVTFALAHMGVATLPCGGLDGAARARVIERCRPTVLACTPSYALYLGRVMQDLGLDPGASSIRKLFIGGEPGMGVDKTRERLCELWQATAVEFYGCTEASPHPGGYSCPMSLRDGHPVTAHLFEDTQVWELVDPDSLAPVEIGRRGVTVCTSLNSECSPQLRFLVGDYTTFDDGVCDCGRTHVRAVGSFTGRADDLITLRGIKLFPSQVEDAVRAVPGVGDEFEIVLDTDPDGLDIMTVRVEHRDHAAPEAVIAAVSSRLRSACEVRVAVDVIAPDTLPKTEFKAKRVRDER